MIATLPGTAKKLKSKSALNKPIRLPDGRSAQYRNCAIPLTPDNHPIAPEHTSACLRCRSLTGRPYGYAQLMQAAAAGVPQRLCNDCRQEIMAMQSLAFQEEAGINLGWRRVDECRQELRAWGRGFLPLGIHEERQ